MSWTALLLAVLVLLLLVVGGIGNHAAASSRRRRSAVAPLVCTTTGPSSLVLSGVPSSTVCVIVYDAAYAFIEQLPFSSSSGSGSVTITAAGQASIVELYSNADCSTYVTNVECVAAPAPGTTILPQPSTVEPSAATPTPAPTSEPTATCNVTSSSTIEVAAVPAGTLCAIVYSPSGTAITQQNVSPVGGEFSLAGLTETSLVEVVLYGVKGCTSNQLAMLTCPAAAATVPPPPPTIKATPTKASNAPAGSRAPTNVRALYVWNLTDCLFNTVEGSTYAEACGETDYLTFQAAVFANVLSPWGKYPAFNRLYVEVDVDTVQTNPAIVQAFLVEAHAKGFAVELLMGLIPTVWVTTSALAQVPMGYCDAVVAFNQASTNPAEWFDGINIDMEPNTLGDSWHTATSGAPDNYNQVYEANLIAILTYCHTVTRPTTMTLSWIQGSDYYYFVHGLWNALIQQQFVDYIVDVVYFNSSSEFMYGGPLDGYEDIGGIDQVLASLQGTVPAVFNAETISPPYAPAANTFWYGGVDTLEAAMVQVSDAFGNTEGFLGYSVHWYGSYFSPEFATGGIQPTCKTITTTSEGTASSTVQVTTYTPFGCVTLYQFIDTTEWLSVSATGLNNQIGTVSLPSTTRAGPFVVRFYDSIAPSGYCYEEETGVVARALVSAQC